MFHRYAVTVVLAGSITVVPFLSGCESLPGNEETQGAVIGGVGGAAAGALIGGEDNRLLGALIGGAAGAGGGYLIGANWDKIRGEDRDTASEEAREANEAAQRRPATAEDVRNSETADLNDDGFVTLDEVVAMDRAGLSEREMITRLERTQQYFELTDAQERHLLDNGVSREVVVAMRDMGPADARQAAEQVIGRD